MDWIKQLKSMRLTYQAAISEFLTLLLIHAEIRCSAKSSNKRMERVSF
jgi:hypothetical protein